MSGTLRKAIHLGFVSLVLAAVARGQQLRQQDPHELERPRSLCSLKGAEVRPTLTWLIGVLQHEGFELADTLWDQGEVRAARTREGGEDRVVLWIARPLGDPLQQFEVYSFGGRFEKFFGATDLRRVLLTSVEEKAIFAKLRQAIVDEALKRG